MKLELDRVIEGVIFDPRDFLSQYPKHAVRQDPIYIVDFVSPAGMYLTVAHCYEIDKGSLKHYKRTKMTTKDVADLTKAHHYTREIEEPFGKYPVTPLAKVAKSIYKAHPIVGYENHIQPALFSSIVCEGTDTFSHKQGRVIQEREPSYKKYIPKKGTMKTVPGKLTNINIGMENVYPIREYIPTGPILNQLKTQTNSILGMYLGF